MLSNLPNDIWMNVICFFNNVDDIINIAILNKDFYRLIDDNYYKFWAEHHYGTEFWTKAQNRSEEISHPLKSMKLELLRINKFINLMKEQDVIWTNKDFYRYWAMLEEVRREKIKKASTWFMPDFMFIRL